MALFRRDKAKQSNESGSESGGNGSHPVLERTAYCRVCNANQRFSNVWLRTARMRKCPACKTAFDESNDPYKRFQPACPACEEPVEADGFEYGYCDGCGSKFELVDGTKPSLLPNKQQREAMSKFGRAWSKD